ncbi:PEP-CTERM sorting domain-containing protein [Pseudobythopirellula maris]|uniref:PEP-CTERM sorting domain-containing protein n=1 Tax=Pseudobythopirellula maris TaxID=2527991 RepID=UPI0018D276E2|nr:PEP-CTERM sorting domain-containing protein [Pseudobythopirellula maris]
MLITGCLIGPAASVMAQGLIYVDAKDGYYPNNNLYSTSEGAIGTLIEPGNNDFVNGDGRFPEDGAWHWANFGSTWGSSTEVMNVCGVECTSVYESLEEDAPLIGMRLGIEPGAQYALTPGAEYDVYVAYWGDGGGNWGVQAGLDSAAMTLFDFDGAEGAVQGSFASSGAWAVKPLDNRTDNNSSEDEFYPASDDNDNPFLDNTPGAPAGSARNLRVGLVGTTMANASGHIDVFIDDKDSLEAGQRSFFDGLAFVPAGTPVFTTGALDRSTGGLTITNPTPADFQINAVRVTSPAGSLNANLWNSITEDGLINDPDGDWAITSPVSDSEVELAESDAGDLDGVTWLSGGATLDLGNVWRKGIFEDITIELDVVGGGTVVITPEYTGTPFETGDFDADGDIDADDYIRLVQGLHVEHATTSAAYAFGDINGSGAVDRSDVLAFAENFNLFNGSGTFAEMVEGLSVPEPSTGLLSLAATGLLALRRRRRAPVASPASRVANKGVLAAAMLVALLAAKPVSAVEVVNWEIDPLVPNSGSNLSNEATSSPTVGLIDGSNVPELDSADQTAIWGSIPIDVNLTNGQEVVLRGSVHLHGGESMNNGAFRWGIFQDDTPDEGEPTGSWLGYLASSSSGGGGGVGDGRLTAKNPDAGDWETATPISTNGTATELGGGGRIYNLSVGGTTDGYADGVYDYGITIGRYGDEVTVSSFLKLAHPEGDYNDNGKVDAADFTVWRDNLGTGAALPNRSLASHGDVSMADYDVWVNNFGNEYDHVLGGGTDTNSIPHPLFPVAQVEDPETMELVDAEVTPHLSFQYNRVAFLLADHLNADYAQFQDTEIAAQAIESVTLEVNAATGEATFKNVSSTDFSMTYYEITSPSDSLVESNWDSLAPDAVIDGVEWDRAAGSSDSILSEVNLFGAPASLPVGVTPISLGNIWDTGGEQDLTLFFIDDEGALIRGIVNYVGASVAVPEPSAIVLLSLAAAMAASIRRRGC